MKKQITDLALAIKDEGIQALLDNKSLQAVVTSLIQQVSEEEAGALIGSILSSIAPRAHGIWLSYKQNRFERNMTILFTELSRQVEELKILYAALSDDMKEHYNNEFSEMMLDNVGEEIQPQKIIWNVNGFIRMMTNDSNENTMKMFFDTLAALTALDIETLKMYSFWDHTTATDLTQKYKINNDQLKMVKEKLVRYGLLVRRNDEQRDKNLDEIVEYLQKKEKDTNSRNPKGVKLSNGIKKITISESYEISRMGRSFLESIGEGRPET